MHSDEPNAIPKPETPVAAVVEAPLPDDPDTVRQLARDTLAWCLANATDTEALPKLNTVLQLVHDPTLARDVVSAAQAVAAPVIADANPTPAAHAHMTVLFALLMEYDRVRDPVDTLFAAWMRHPKSYGPAHATPPEFQREVFVQRLGDMLGWGTLDANRDCDALERFAYWFDTWTPKNKFRARRAFDLLRRNFPAHDVWSVVRFPQGGGQGHGQGHKNQPKPKGGNNLRDEAPAPQGPPPSDNDSGEAT